MKKYIVTLTEAERTMLDGLVRKGKAAARKLAHGRMLLKADVGSAGPGWTDQEMSAA